MYELITIALIVGYLIILCLVIFTTIHILTHQNEYGSQLLAFLNILAIIFSGILYSTFFIISLILIPSEVIWKVSIVCGSVNLGFAVLIYSFVREYKKIPRFPLICYASLFGLQLGSLFSPDSIILINETSNSHQFLIMDVSKINYIFNITTGLITAIFQIAFVSYLLYISIVINYKARNQKITKNLIISTSITCIPTFLYVFYIFSSVTIFRELHIFLVWLNLIVVCFMLITKPSMFVALTNKIYYLNIYHKSGILLYSYKFEKEEEISDSAIWGNILIGINHILSEFIDKKDQIDVMQTKITDIVVNYNNEHGFAVLVITNKKNEILEKFIGQFMNDFINRYKTELNLIQDLNKIINVSEFEDTKEIIEDNFQIYL